jgi:nucleoside diphosphate kinase
MENIKTLEKLVVENIRKAQNNLIFHKQIFGEESSVSYGKNNFLFFIKPEITAFSQTTDLEKLISIIFDKLIEFGFKIHDISILSGEYLEKYNLIEQHYGVIAHMASDPVKYMSETAAEKFKELYGVDHLSVKLLGGDQMLEQYPFFNYHSLDCLWQNNENIKLAGGAYVEKIRIDLETIYLINGFNPRQLKHFTEKGRCIVTMNISNDLSWKEARNNFVGATKPQNANPGSLRREFLDRKEELGLSEVSQSYNGVHLSAGPVEALVELRRFYNEYVNCKCRDIADDLPFGKALKDVFGFIPEEVLDNSVLEIDGHHITVFDLTEETESEEAIELLKKHLQ